MIGVGFDGRQIRAGKVEKGRVVKQSQSEVKSSQPKDILDSIAAAALKLERSPESVGVAIPGVVDPQGLCWRFPNVPAFKGVHIGRELTRRIRCTVAVENRATAAALGERMYGHGRRHPSFLVVTLGVGIGGGLVIGHRLYPGAYGFAAEFGHVPVESEAKAWACRCGLRGCLEAYAGSRGLLRGFLEEGCKADDPSHIVVSARAGGPGMKTLSRMGTALGKALANIQNILDLSAIVFAEGLSTAFDLIEPSLREQLRISTYALPLAEVPLLVSELGDQAGILGAAHLTRL